MTAAVLQLTKDPQAVLDYHEDWSDWLPTGDTISTAAWSVASGDVTIDSESATPTVTTVWLSGGTADTTAEVTCHITTAAGREDDRTIELLIQQR